MNRPMISIIMPAWNSRRFLPAAVSSVREQTLRDWELIIVDDASTDGTGKLIRSLADSDKRIRRIRLEENRGVAAARNAGLGEACGRYVAFLDSDDLWHPDKLTRQLAFMAAQGSSFSCTAYTFINRAGKPEGRTHYPPLETDHALMLRLSNPVKTSTVLYDRELLGSIRVPDMRNREDFGLWLRLLKQTKSCAGLQEPLAAYRHYMGSLSRSTLRLPAYHWHLYREAEGLNIPESLRAMGCWLLTKGTKLGLDIRREIPADFDRIYGRYIFRDNDGAIR